MAIAGPCIGRYDEMANTVLLVSVYQARILDGTSNYQAVALNTAKALTMHGFQVLLPIPIGCEQYFPPVWDGLVYVPMRMTLNEVREEVMLTEPLVELFHQYRGKFCYDAVFNWRTLCGALIQKLLSQPPGGWRLGHLKVPVPIFQGPKHQTMLPGVPQMTIGVVDIACERSMFLDCDRILVLAPQQLDVVREGMLTWLTPAAAQGVVDKTVCVYIGMDIDWYDQWFSRPERRDGNMVLYAGRDAVTKGIDWIVKVMYYLGSTGVRCVLNSPLESKQWFKEAARLGLEVHEQQNYHQFLARLQRATVFLMASSAEGLTLTFVEAVLAGCIVVLRRAEWQRGILVDDYPFVVGDSVEEAVGLVKWILVHPDEAREHMRSQVEWVRETLSLDAYGGRLSGLIRDAWHDSLVAYWDATRQTKTGEMLFGAFDAERDRELDSVFAATAAVKKYSQSAVAPNDFFVRSALKYWRGDYA